MTAPTAPGGRNGTRAGGRGNGAPSYHPNPCRSTFAPWSIGPVEVPTRLVLAPMAGVSVQAFRRQGRRFGAGLVCSEMVSCAGIEHRQRADARLPPRRGGRASARDPDLRLRSRRDGRGGADGGGGGRGHRRRQLRLPREEGDEDRRRRDAARGSRPRVPDRRRRSRRRRRAGQREDAPRPAGRLARRPRGRAAARRGRRADAHPPSRARRSRCTRARPTTR